jgi:hypothetical protein
MNVIEIGKTDASGAFQLSFITAGSYALTITPPSTLTDYHRVLASIVSVAGEDAGILVLPHK